MSQKLFDDYLWCVCVLLFLFRFFLVCSFFCVCVFSFTMSFLIHRARKWYLRKAKLVNRSRNQYDVAFEPFKLEMNVCRINRASQCWFSFHFRWFGAMRVKDELCRKIKVFELGSKRTVQWTHKWKCLAPHFWGRRQNGNVITAYNPLTLIYTCTQMLFLWLSVSVCHDTHSHTHNHYTSCMLAAS